MLQIDGSGLLLEVGTFKLRLQRRDIGFGYGSRSAYVLWGGEPQDGGIFITGRDWSWSRNWLGYVVAKGSDERPDAPANDDDETSADISAAA